MADASGQGFTASIVNSVPNYLSSDRSTLGMVDGITGTIQYVKLVWGNSGNAYFVDDQGANPTPLPVGLNNAENYWLIDAVRDTVKDAGGGETAVNVNIVNGEGLCFGNVSISLGSGVTIVGIGAGVSGLGVTFNGNVGITTSGPIAVRNHRVSGVTESLWVTGGVYILGGLTVSGGSFDLSAGVTITGISLQSGVSLPAFIVGGTGLNVSGTVRLAAVSSGLTLPVVLTNQFGGLLGLSGGTVFGIPIVGSVGATAVGVTFAGITFGGITMGTVGATFGGITMGTVGATFGGITFGTAGVTFRGITMGTVGSTFGVVNVRSSSPSNTFGVVFTNNFGEPLGLSGVTVFGIPVFGVSGATAIKVEVVGGLSGITVSGISFPGSFALNGGTVDFVRGGTLDLVRMVSSIGFISGGTVSVTNTVGVTVTNQVNVFSKNNTDSEAIPVRYRTGWTDMSGLSLAEHLKGLTVNVAGFGGSSGFVIGGFTSAIEGRSVTGLGVTFNGISLQPNQTIKVENVASGYLLVKGDATQRAEANAVGVTLIGPTNVTFGGGIIGVSLAGIQSTGGALVVSVVGGLSGITVSGISFPGSFALNGGTVDFVRGGTLDLVRMVSSIGFISGGTVSVTNTVGVTVNNAVVVRGPTGSTVGVILTRPNSASYPGIDLAIPVQGATNATPIGVQGTTDATPVEIRGGTLSWRNDFLVGVTGTVRIPGGLTGPTLGVVVVQPNGLPYTGGTFGIPVYGVLGITAIGVTFGAVTFGVTLPFGLTSIADSVGRNFLGVTFTGTISTSVEGSGIRIAGVCAAGTSFAIPVYLASPTGATGYEAIRVGGTTGATPVEIKGGTLSWRSDNLLGITGTVQIGGIPAGTTLPVTLVNFAGSTFPGGLSGMPVFGVSGATAVGVTFGFIPGTSLDPSTGITFMTVSPVLGPNREPGVTFTGRVSVWGAADSAIGVTLGSGGAILVRGNVAVFNSGGVNGTFGVTTGTISIRQGSQIVGAVGSTIGVVLTDPRGAALTGGLSGAGLPVFGVLGATAIAVTFGVVTFPSSGVGVTFGGITFNTTRTIVVGTSFADGGGALGMPVYGVAGATSVRVQIEGGTVSGIFITEAPGITVMGVSTGIPVIGVSGGQPIGVTFTQAPLTIGGITINSILPGVTLNVTGGVFILGNSGSGSLNVNTVTTVTTLNAISNDVPVKAGNEMASAGKIWGITSERGIVVTEKHGSQFAIGLTLSNEFITTILTNGFTGTGLSFGGGNTAWYFKNTPVCITKNYTGPSQNGELNEDGFPRVPLKKGVYVQFTKWDLISHVHVGYTSGNSNTYDYLRDSQILNREYQAMPLWGGILDQYKNQSDQIIGQSDGIGGLGLSTKNYVGMIEKPTRIFLPCKDASEIYIQPIGDYRNHTIGGGFWVYNYDGISGATWSDTTLYERSWYSSDYSAIKGFQGQDPLGGRPDLSITGGAINITAALPAVPAFAGSAVQQILNSYKFNPFVRIWGY